MPKLLVETRLALDWLDTAPNIIPAHDAHTRAKGVHLSGIIRYVLVQMKLLTPFEVQEEEMPIRVAMGTAWEAHIVKFIAKLYPAFVWQPGEYTEDGVTGNPDGLNYINIGGKNVGVVEEFKATWKTRFTHSLDSSKPNPEYKPITSVQLWMWQLAGYCYMLGVRHARLHVFWVNGDYRPPSPDFRTYLIEFTQEELDKFWNNVVLVNKDKAEAE